MILAIQLAGSARFKTIELTFSYLSNTNLVIMASTRQLAAIMFTDIVGYTAMMGDDEQKAFDILHKNREVQQPIIKRFHGVLIKELGDGMLASFYTVTDAVNCARAIQHSCLRTPDLKLRIGIHLGEVLFEENDVFGDGVNIASRLQTLAPSGGIWISEAVNKIISNKKEFKTRFIGEEVLKNVKEPVQIYEVELNGFLKEHGDLFSNENKPREKSLHKSVAVLPFVNMSNDPEQEYFSDGMTEEIINSLVHLRDLKVAGRMSSFQFKGVKADLREVGEKLGVSTVLEGSVRRQGNKLRVTAQLINVEDGFHLWSEKYDSNIDDIFAIQDEIALSITQKLKVTLLQEEREKITVSYTQNTDAYELYLKGRYHLNKRGHGILNSMQYFQKAIDIDPDFALPYVGYADANLLLATYGLAPPKLVLPQAKQAAERALQLNSSLCEPYCSLGYYYMYYEWNWAEAKKNYLKALELNPQYCQAHSWYGWNFLACVEGKFDEAEKHGEILIKLEPLCATYYGSYSLILHIAGKYKEALAICQMGIELDESSFLCFLNEGNIYITMQKYDEAIRSYETAIKVSNRHHFIVNGLIWTYCLMGNYEKARVLMNELKERSSKEYIASTFTAFSAAYLGDLDEAFDFLEKAFNEKDPILLILKYEKWGPPTFRNDPRFQKTLERIGLPK